jgi:hypothetical protein
MFMFKCFRWITWANVLFNDLIGQTEILTWVRHQTPSLLPDKNKGMWSLTMQDYIPMKLNFTSAQFECIWSEFN